MNNSLIDKLNFSKLGGLIPAIIQDANSLQVLMVGFMNRDAVEKTLAERKTIFWSRTKQRLWQKGETSGNTLEVLSVETDCDNDALLIKAIPLGPVCHTGTYTCFGEQSSKSSGDVFGQLEKIVRNRQEQMPEQSYTAKLFQEGTSRIAQKVGEEAVEVVVAAMQNDATALKAESADLLYHLIVLLREKGLSLNDVAEELRVRMDK
ncbi:MAG: bifunctional phosphoribosyl-AMP cyclohydrolase/phosphoribosyl-ATP diphosphatase HisIE [Ignavibacteriales bacterium]|nr:bifunctional phosphoribosyl-AMP cyclohydrolase/phosphoribosyl-ATP diphosphatase HisIE [Ignavibacteriales bacterium]